MDMIKMDVKIRISKEKQPPEIANSIDTNVQELSKGAAAGNESACNRIIAFDRYKTARAALGLPTKDTDILVGNTATLEKQATEFEWLATANKKQQAAAAAASRLNEPNMSTRRQAAFAALRTACASAGLTASNASETLNESLSDEQLERKARAIAARGKTTVGNFNKRDLK